MSKKFFLILIILILVFFFPKYSFKWGSGTGLTKDCLCFGIEKKTSEIVIDGSSSRVCFGLVHSCARINQF